MDPMLQKLADFATSIRYEDIGQESVHQSKRRIIDTLGCMIGAYHMEPARIARHYAMQAIGNPGATLFGTRFRTTPELAALANGILARYLDFNDTGSTRDAGHPSDMIPAMLAVAEAIGADAKAALTGIVAAYEVMERLAETLGLTQIGFDYTTYVAIGTAAGASNILGLSRGKTANAIALATASYIGLLQIRMDNLSMWKGCSPGNASRNGVSSAMIAGLGMTGPDEAFHGRYGFFKMVSEAHAVMEVKPFGSKDRPYMIEVSKLKCYPTDYECQTAANPAVELHHVLKGRIEEIEKVVVHAYQFAMNVTATKEKWDPKTRETADHSLPYVVATALITGGVCHADFEEENFRSPHRLDLMKKIECYEDPEHTSDYPKYYRFRIEVTLKSGEKVVRDVRHGKGHPQNPLSDQDIETKFRKLSKHLLLPRQIDQGLETLWNFEGVDDMSAFLSIFEM
jgi:2-methylcitrate dehydratase